MIAATLVVMAMACAGCSVQQPPAAGPPAEAAHALPFKGRLISGDPGELPPAVAMSLSDSSPISFAYREELTHDEHHESTALSSIDPLAYLGRPTGEFGVTAFASLTITDGGRVIGDYTAKTRVTQPYSIYSQPTHRELDDAARRAVRQAIDQKLYDDSGRLSGEIAGTE